MKKRLTNLQKIFLHELVTHGRLYIGTQTPRLERIFNALVEKGYATKSIKGQGGWEYTYIPRD